MIKQATACPSLDELVRYVYKPNLKTLGPRYGKLLGAIRQELPGIDPDLLAPLRAGQDVNEEVDFDAIQRAILEIEKRSNSLDDVRKSAETIHSASQKILERVQRTRQSLEKQVQLLYDKVSNWLNHSNPHA